jgi:hypothetical protein
MNLHPNILRAWVRTQYADGGEEAVNNGIGVYLDAAQRALKHQNPVLALELEAVADFLAEYLRLVVREEARTGGADEIVCRAFAAGL